MRQAHVLTIILTFFFGFEPDTSYFLETVIDYVFTQTSIHVNDTFNIDIQVGHVTNLAGWQFDIAFDPTALEAVEVSEGDFLKTDSGTTFFQGGRIDNAAGKITGLIAGRITDGGVSGSGSVIKVRFKAKAEGETELALSNFLFGSNTEESIPAGPLEIRISVEERLLTGDVNRDGVVNILDLIRVARQLGQRVPSDSPVDINGDGVVNIFDLTLVAQGIGKTTGRRRACNCHRTGRCSDDRGVDCTGSPCRRWHNCLSTGHCESPKPVGFVDYSSRDGVARQLPESVQP